MKKKYVKYIILVLILIAVCIGIFILYKHFYDESKTHLIISPNTELECHSLNCKSITINSYTRSEFDVYIKNEFIGNYNLKRYDNKWYIYDYDYKFIEHGDNMIAIDKSSKAKVIEYTTSEFNNDDDAILEDILKDNDITSNTKTISQKIELDFDSDNQNEILYIASNIMANDDSDKVYSFVYFKDDEDIEFVEKIIASKGSELSINRYTLNSIIDLNDDDKYEVVLSSNNIDDCHSIYKLSFGKYKAIKSCE